MSIGATRPDQVAAAAQEPVLSVSGLTTSFLRERQWSPVVRDVSFDVAAKETVAIVGESGSGKSVTALSIMRLIPIPPGRIAGGSIKLRGVNLLEKSEPEMRKIRGKDIAMIFQDPMTSLNPSFTVGFQIEEALNTHGIKGDLRQKTIDLLKQVGIPDPASRLDSFPHQLSGGMSQRVMIAMAIACEPERSRSRTPGSRSRWPIATSGRPKRTANRSAI